MDKNSKQIQQMDIPAGQETVQLELELLEPIPSTSTAAITPIATNNLIQHPADKASSSGLQILHVESLTSTDIFGNSLGPSTFDSSLDGSANTKRRRKNAHVPVALNDELEFPDVPDKSGNNDPDIEADLLDCLENVKNMPNANIDLISKASFLRVSVEFLMEELGMKPLVLDNNSSVANLKAQYLRNKKVMKRN